MSRNTLFRRRKAAGLVRPRKRHFFNEQFFDTWSDELAWLIGVIWSDGCLFHNTIEICSKDLQLIELAAAIIEGTGIMPKNKGTALRLLFSSPQVTGWLKSIGLTEAKSLTIGWPTIPEHYESPFVRGLLDGDGAVMRKKDRPGQQAPDVVVAWFGASVPLQESLIGWLSKHSIRHSTRISHDRVWEIRVVHQASLHKLYGLLYDHPDVACLHRKHATFKHWIETPRFRSGRPIKEAVLLPSSSYDE